VSVGKALLARQQNLALLFCGERSFCGALRLDGQSALALKRRVIVLAPYAIE